MPNYNFNSINMDDVTNGSVIALDELVYQPHLLWSPKLWREVVKGSVVNRAVRINENGQQKMIGNIEVMVEQDRLNPFAKSLLIYNIIVSPAHQNQGLATKLMYETSQAIINLQEAGWYTDYDHIDLSVERDNSAAIALYHKCGFTEYNYSGAKSYKIYMRQNVNDFAEMMSLIMQQKLHSNLPFG